jgi:hypothetical protein
VKRSVVAPKVGADLQSGTLAERISAALQQSSEIHDARLPFIAPSSYPTVARFNRGCSASNLGLLLFENNWLRVQFMLTLNFGTQIDHPERSPNPIDGYHLA